MLKIYCDGGARGNPGPSAFGFVVKKDEKNIKSNGGYIGIATNNVAEYTAVIEALKWLKGNYFGSRLHFFIDSQLVASQLNGLYKIKNANLSNLIFKIRELENSFATVVYEHIPREQNKEADKLVNIELDVVQGKI